MNDIHDNFPPIHLPFFTVLDWGILAIIVFGFSYVLWKKFFQKIEQDIIEEKPKTVFKFIPQKFSFRRSLEELKKLKKEEKWKEFSLQATQVFKSILEERFQKKYNFATGKELETLLKNGVSVDEKRELIEFFQLVDPVKFAQASGKEKMAEKIIRLLNTFHLSK